MQWLASICVRRPVFATVLILFIVVVGIVGYKQLNVDRFPNVDLPVVNVITLLPGAAPEEVATELSDKIEEAINTINGIDELRSISTEGVSQVVVSFKLDKDVNVAAQEVREHVPSLLTLRVSGRVPSAEAVGEIVVRNVENHPIMIRDVGQVVDGQEEATTAASIAGKEAVILSIRKQSGENSVAVVDALRARMKE